MKTYKRPPAKAHRTQKSISQVETALRQTLGNVTYAAEALDMTVGGLNKRIRENPRLQIVKAEAQETLVDAAEGLIAHAILKQRDVKTARFVVERKGRERGWGTKYKLSEDDLKRIVDEVCRAVGRESDALKRIGTALGVDVAGEQEDDNEGAGSALF